MNKILWKEKILINPETEKEWWISIDGACIRTSLNHRKIKEQIIEQRTEDKAIQLLCAQLRKGYLYYNPHANFSEPILHQFLDRAYTGAMPLAARPDTNEFYAIRTIGNFEDEILYHFGENGRLLHEYHLGSKRNTYQAVWAADGTLYFDNGHHIERFAASENKTIELGGPTNRVDSTLDSKGDHVMWCADNEIVVIHSHSNREVFRKSIVCQPVETLLEKYYCFAKLSPTGKQLLYRIESEFCHVVDLKTGKESVYPAADGYYFFSPDEKYLYMCERVFDLTTGLEIKIPPAPFVCPTNGYAKGCTGTILETKKVLAASYNNMAFTIWNFDTNKAIATICDNFIVRNANYALTKDWGVVHTDYGVLSIYNLKI